MTEDEMVSITNSMDMNLSKLWEVQGCLVYCSPLNRRVGHDLAIEQQVKFENICFPFPLC